MNLINLVWPQPWQFLYLCFTAESYGQLVYRDTEPVGHLYKA